MTRPTADRFNETVNRLSPEHRAILQKMVSEMPRPLTAVERLAYEEFLAFLRAPAQQQEVQSTQGSVSAWISVKERLPDDETPVLIMLNGSIRIGERRWEEPTFEDTYQRFWYWDDPFDDGQPWENHDVTHWMPLPEPSGSTAHKDESEGQTISEANELEIVVDECGYRYVPIHSFEASRAQLATTRTALKEMRKDRDLWRDEHEGDCPVANALATAEALNRELGDALQWLLASIPHLEGDDNLTEPIALASSVLAKLPTPPETKEKP